MECMDARLKGNTHPCRAWQGGALANIKALKALGEGVDAAVLRVIVEAGKAKRIVLELGRGGLAGAALAAQC